MQAAIKFTKVCSDEDMATLDVDISDGRSSFANQIYVGYRHLHDTVEGLNAFKNQIHGGIFNLRFGVFGAEYASGALDARMQFRQRGKILVQVSAQSEFVRFDEKDLCSEAKLFLVTETALLDAFIVDLRALSEGGGSEAVLEAISWN